MYKNFFGLSESPFSISPNPKFFYLSSHHREALAQLKRGISQSGGFVLFTGEVGTGKTVIARTLISELPGNVDRAIIYDPDLSLIEILEKICSEFSIDFEPNSSKRVLVEKISNFLTDNYQHGRRAILMIDEAQHLSDEIIEQVRLLTNIETDNEKLLQVILIGQPELADILRQQHMRQIAQRITARFHLLPLSVDELDSYIRFRMQSAGCVQVVFSPQAVSTLYKASQGIPRVINVMADRALQEAFLDRSHVVLKKHMQKAICEVLGTKDVWGIFKDLLKKAPSIKGTLINLTSVALFGVLGYLLGNLCSNSGHYEQNELVERLKSDETISSLSANFKNLLNKKQQSLNTQRERERYLAAISNSQFEEDVFRSLKSVWGFAQNSDSLDIDSECNQLSQKGFRCLSGRGSLDEIVKYNVPVLISIINEKKTPYYAVIIGVDENFVELLMYGRRWVLPRDYVANFMEGDFRLIWPLPKGAETVNSRSSSEVQAMLAQMLINFENDPDYVFNGWDNILVTKIKSFQARLGLTVDGIVGVDTLWALLPYAETEHPIIRKHILPINEEQAYLKTREQKLIDAQEKEANRIDLKQKNLSLKELIVNDHDSNSEEVEEPQEEIQEVNEPKEITLDDITGDE